MRVEAHGPEVADYLVIGEAPGAEEGRYGIPFVGASGKLIKQALSKLGVDPNHDVRYTNVIKEYKDGNPTPTTEEIKAALPELRAEIAAGTYKHILCVGAVAKQAVTGSKEGILKIQGQLLHARKDLEKAVGDSTIMAIMHPAYVLRNNTPASNATFLAVMGSFVAQAKPTATETVQKADFYAGEGVTRGAIDIEATPYPWWHEKHKLVSAAVSFDGKTAFTYDLQDPADFEKLRHLSTMPIKWVMHNGKYDRQALLHAGMDFELVFDTMTAQYLIDPDQRKGLEFLAGVYLGLPPYKDVNYDKILDEDPDKVALMNGRDAIKTFRLYDEIMKPKIVADERLNRLFQFLMMPAVNALLELELKGIPIDVGKLADLTDTYEEGYGRHLLRLRDFTRNPNFNPASSQQVRDFFFGERKLPIVKRTATGAASFDAEARAQLMVMDQGVKYFDEYKKVAQSLSMFLRPWDELERNGYLYTSYKPSHVVTGRLSSERPNFQQVPRDVRFRQLFGGVKGFQVIELDYSQIELRMAAWQAGEKTMLEAYENDADLHTVTAELILGDPKGRQVGKTLNFGLLYGAGPLKLREVAFNEYDVRLTLDQAERYHAQFFATYPALKHFHNHIRNTAKRQKYIDSPIGRRRYFPNIDNYDRKISSHEENAALNHPIQSMASDLMLYSLTKLHKELPQGTRVLATIHDSVLLLALEPEVDAVIEQAVEIMEVGVVRDIYAKWGVDITVPLKVDWSANEYWKGTDETI